MQAILHFFIQLISLMLLDLIHDTCHGGAVTKIRFPVMASSDNEIKKLNQKQPCSSPNPEECGDLFEGDIDLFGQSSVIHTKSAVVGSDKLWPNRIVPYEIDPNAGFTSPERKIINDGIAHFQKITCIKFTPRSLLTNDYVRFGKKGPGCSSAVGHQADSGAPQEVSLVGECLNFGTVLHELMHVVGFYHEHARFDRDDYIDIVWRNVKSGKKYNFLKYYLKLDMQALGPYDYGSVMHYSNKAFTSKASRDTIIPKIASVSIGQREKMSQLDIWKVNKLYNCPGVSNLPPPHIKPVKAREKVVSLPIQEDFEWSYGSFYQEYSGDDLDWERTNGPTESMDTGPNGDHTSGSGVYVYVEASDPAKSGFKAQLWSSQFKQNGFVCLQFWYHMYGIDMGVFRVYSKENNDLSLLFSDQGNKGPLWNLKNITFECSGECQVVFEGVLKTGFASDMALDDIIIYAGKCRSPPVVGRMLPFYCDFDNDDCGFFAETSPSAIPSLFSNLNLYPEEMTGASPALVLEWKRWNGIQVPSKGNPTDDLDETRPSFATKKEIVKAINNESNLLFEKIPSGNTQKQLLIIILLPPSTGYFMFVNGTNSPSARAVMISPAMNGTGNRCLEFRYAIFTENAAENKEVSSDVEKTELRVFLAHGKNGSFNDKLPWQTGRSGAMSQAQILRNATSSMKWRTAKVSIANAPNESRIMFEAVFAPLGNEVIAVDNVTFKEDFCLEKTTSITGIGTEKPNYHGRLSDGEIAAIIIGSVLGVAVVTGIIVAATLPKG